MQLAYQEYVKRLNYEPYQWPPDISLAELHSRVSEQGPINPSGVKCPCCNFQSKMQFKGWISRDINEDCRGYGTAIPAFFGLLMYYTIALFIVICLNVIYPIWAVYFTCQNIVQETGAQSCIKFGFLYYIDLATELNLLSTSGNQDIVDNLIILETVTFYFLMAVNLSSLVYLYNMQKKENEQMKNKRFHNHAIILGNVPQTDPSKIKELLNIPMKHQIIDIIPLKQYKRYFQLFHKRNIVYYKLMSKCVISQDPRAQKKLNKKLIQSNALFLIQKQKMAQQKFTNLLVFFKSSFARAQVLDSFSLDQIRKIQYGTKQVFTEIGVDKESWQLPIYVIKVPDVNQIKWENAGENIKSKLAGRIKTFVISMGLILIALFIFYGPLSWSLSTQASNPGGLTVWQKWLPIIISFLLFLMSALYHQYMHQVAKKRFPVSQFQASKFVLLSSMLFHLLFYIVLPVIFFAIPNSINSTTKLFVIAAQAHTFVILQLILNLIDIPYQMWKSKKIKNLSDQREGFKYNQAQLHKQVQFRDFPLQFRIQSMFKIWSFALFYAFYLPYMVINIFVILIIIYILQKHNFYKHYALRRAISLQLQKSFLIYFVNFFGIFQCFSYCYNAVEIWMVVSAVITTLLLLIGNFVFWKCIHPGYLKKKQISKGKEQQLLEEEKEKEDDMEIAENVKRTAQQFRQSYQIFTELNANENLDDEIYQYIKSLEKEDTEITVEDKQEVQKFIQMADSDLQKSLQ